LNKLYIGLLKKILGVPKGTSNHVTLVRCGELPLDYALACNALIWYLKARNGPNTLLRSYYLNEKADDLRWALSIFFRPAEELLTRLNDLVEVDLFSFKDTSAKFWIRKAMCWELSDMWFRENMSHFTKRLYKRWSCIKLNPLMLTKISTTWYHQLPVGRGYLNSIQHKYYPSIDPHCRFGCGCDETVDHIFLRCPFVDTERLYIQKLCTSLDLPFILSSIFIAPELKLSVERLLLRFIRHN